MRVQLLLLFVGCVGVFIVPDSDFVWKFIKGLFLALAVQSAIFTAAIAMKS